MQFTKDKIRILIDYLGINTTLKAYEGLQKWSQDHLKIGYTCGSILFKYNTQGWNILF